MLNLNNIKMLDLLITTVGIIFIYILPFFCKKHMKHFITFLMVPNFVIILVLIYAEYTYKKLDLWKYPEEYHPIQKTKFLPIKSIKGIYDSSENLINLDFGKTDGIFSIVKNDEYSKECLHNYYIKQTSECPMTDIILEKTQVNTHSNYIEQKISDNIYLYYTKESNLDGKLYQNLSIKSAGSGSSCSENNEFTFGSTCFKVLFESNFNAKNVQSIVELEKEKKSDPFNSLKKYVNYSDKICVLLILLSIAYTYYEPPSDKRFNVYKIISWISHFLVLILLIVRYHKYRKIKQFLNQDKETYKEYLPLIAFNLDTVPISISISIFVYYILYLIVPESCHIEKNDDDNTEAACFTDWRSEFSSLLLPIFIVFCFMIVYDVMNDILIEENYKIISSNWNQNSVKSISADNHISLKSPKWKDIYIKYSLNEYNYFDISKKDDNSKICGKDSQGNDLYFPKDVECPINDIFVSKFDLNEFPDYTKIQLNDENEYLYYTNKKITGKIVIALEVNKDDILKISVGMKYDDFKKFFNSTKLETKVSRFNTMFFYEELASLNKIENGIETVSDKLYAINYLGVNNKLIGKVKDFEENLEKYKSITILKYISYAFYAFDFIYYSCIFLFEDRVPFCTYGLGIIFLPTAIFFIIINLWCLHINLNYAELFLNKINIDFERNRCDCVWNFLLTLIGILFFIYYIFIFVHGFMERCDCPKTGNVTRPVDTNEVVIRHEQHKKHEEPDSKEKIYKIFKDNTKAGNEPTCLICLNNKAIIVLSPCRHKCVCEACFNDINSRRLKKCPICRQNIVGKIVPENSP